MRAISAIAAVLLVSHSAASAPVPRDRPPDPFAWAYMGVRVETNSLQVSSTDPGTPANIAGIQPNDLIVRIGKLTPMSFDEVAIYIITLRPGTRVTVEIRRGGETLHLPLVLGERPQDTPLPAILLQKLYQRQPNPNIDDE